MSEPSEGRSDVDVAYLDLSNRREPGPMQAHLLAECPVHRVDQHDPPFFVVSRDADVRSVLRDTPTFLERAGARRGVHTGRCPRVDRPARPHPPAPGAGPGLHAGADGCARAEDRHHRGGDLRRVRRCRRGRLRRRLRRTLPGHGHRRAPRRPRRRPRPLPRVVRQHRRGSRRRGPRAAAHHPARDARLPRRAGGRTARRARPWRDAPRRRHRPHVPGGARRRGSSAATR